MSSPRTIGCFSFLSDEFHSTARLYVLGVPQHLELNGSEVGQEV